MKPINKDELFSHVSQFLKGKGIEFKEGSYAQGIKKSCGFLTDAINLSQQGIQKAKTEIDKNLERVRQVIHERTAPKPPVMRPGANGAAKKQRPGKASPKAKARKAKGRKA
jgi:ABC-type hemin transport system substrate-binding protein